MDQASIKRPGYSFSLVNIDCLPNSTHFNILMDMERSVESLLPYLAAVIPGCTYVHGTGVVQYMDRGHIVAIYPQSLTVTDVHDGPEAESLCAEYFRLIQRVERDRGIITPVMRKQRSISVLDIYRRLPQTNCGLCGLPTCLALAAGVFRQETLVMTCEPVRNNPERFGELVDVLRANGYQTT